MTCHSLLVLVFGLSCFALSTCNVGDMASLPILYPSKVLNTTQQGCPPDEQLETTRAEIGQEVHSILQRHLGKHTLMWSGPR